MKREATVAVVFGLLAGCFSDPDAGRVRCDDLACADGSCAGEAFAVGHAERLRADASRLYWIDLADPARAGDERLLATPLAGGGPVEDLAATQTFTRGLRVNAGWAAWSTSAGIHAVAMPPPVTGGEVVSSSEIQYGFDVDEDAVYYGVMDGERGLWRTTLAGHASSLVTAGAYPLDVVVRGGDAYFTTCSGVSRVATTGGPAEALVTDECAVWLAAAGDQLAWWSFSDKDGYAIRAFDLSTRTERRLALMTQLDANIVALEADDTDVYFASDTSICRVPLAGGDAVKVAEGQAFTLSADAIYWATAAGEIRRRAK